MQQNNLIHSGSHLKKILTKGSWYFVSSLLIKAMTIITWPIVTRYLAPNDFGILDSIESIRQFLPILISLCLDEAYYRFFFNHNKNKDELKKYVSTYFWIIIAWGLLVVISSLFIGKIILVKIFHVNFYPFIFFTMIGPLMLQLSILGGMYLKQQLKSEFFSIIEVISWCIFYVTFLLLLIKFNLGAQSKIYAFFLFDLFLLIVFSIVLIKDKLLTFKIDFKILIEGMNYSIPLIPNQTAFWINGLSDRILIGIFKSFSSTGIYSIAYRLGQSLTIFSENIFKVYKPIMFSMFASDKNLALEKIRKFIPSFFFIMFWLSLCMSFFAKEAILILTDKRFHMAYTLVPIIVSAYFLQAMYKPFYNIISFYKKTWIISVGAILQAFINFGLNLILIPIFDRTAAAWTTLGSFLGFFLWLFFWSQHYERIKIDYIKLLIIASIGIFPILIFYLINLFFEFNIAISIVIKLILVIIFILLSFKFKLVEFKFKKPNYNEK